MKDSEFDDRIRQAFADEPFDPAALERSIRAGMARSRRLPYAGLIAALAAVLLTGLYLRRVPKTFRDAARDHRLEVVEHHPRHWRPGPEWSALSVPAGFRLEHAKICGLEGKPVWHLVYTD